MERDTMPQALVEHSCFMDIQSFKGLENGQYKVTMYRYQSIVEVKNGKYIIDGQEIHTATTKVGYGERKWFVCPTCSQNTKRLYLPYGAESWKCRECHYLIYLTSRMSGNNFKYITERIRRIQKQFDMSKSYSYLGLTDCEIESVPLFKPKYMRQAKFDELCFELECLIIERYRLWCAMVE